MFFIIFVLLPLSSYVSLVAFFLSFLINFADSFRSVSREATVVSPTSCIPNPLPFQRKKSLYGTTSGCRDPQKSLEGHLHIFADGFGKFAPSPILRHFPRSLISNVPY